MKTDSLFEHYYYRRSGFIDGTSQFHDVCRTYITSGCQILEIGAGPDNPTSSFLGALGALTGVDISDEVLNNRALEKAYVFDGHRLPFPDSSFQACVSNYVIEHVERPSEHFMEAARVLKEGGIYCFRTPNLWHYVTLGSKIFNHAIHVKFANQLRGLGDDHHAPYPTFYRSNTGRSIRHFSQHAGFSEEQLLLVEKEPSYGRIHPMMFYPMMVYERVVNSSLLLSSLRVNIFGVLRKSRLKQTITFDPALRQREGTQS